MHITVLASLYDLVGAGIGSSIHYTGPQIRLVHAFHFEKHADIGNNLEGENN